MEPIEILILSILAFMFSLFSVRYVPRLGILSYLVAVIFLFIFFGIYNNKKSDPEKLVAEPGSIQSMAANDGTMAPSRGAKRRFVSGYPPIYHSIGQPPASDTYTTN